MILIDANLLLYAYNAYSPAYAEAREWFQKTLNGTEPARASWITILAFCRISTNARIFDQPYTAAEAMHVVDEWLAQPKFGVLQPGARFHGIFRQLTTEGQCKGDLFSDAYLAALAIEHGCTLHTTDRDFTRFPGLKHINPLTR